MQGLLVVLGLSYHQERVALAGGPLLSGAVDAVWEKMCVYSQIRAWLCQAVACFTVLRSLASRVSRSGCGPWALLPASLSCQPAGIKVRVAGSCCSQESEAARRPDAAAIQSEAFGSLRNPAVLLARAWQSLAGRAMVVLPYRPQWPQRFG